MRTRHPQYLELPVTVHADEAGRSVHQAWRQHWLLIVGLILLAILLIGVTVTGNNR